MVNINLPISTKAAKVVQEAFKVTNNNLKLQFQANVLHDNSGVYMGDNNMAVQILAAADRITYAQMLSIMESTHDDWAVQVEKVVTMANSQSTSARIDRLTELTLSAMEKKPISRRPMIYDSKKHSLQGK